METEEDKIEDEEDDVGQMTNKNRRERFAINKSYSIENGYQSHRRNLVDDAKFETKVHQEVTDTLVKDLKAKSEDDLEDDVFVLESIAEAKKNNEEKLRVALLLSFKEAVSALPRICKIVEVIKAIN